MPKIIFKGKVENVYNMMDETIAYKRIKVPTLARRHCDINTFRNHKKYGMFINSDIFNGVLARIKRDYLGEYIRLDKIPNGVTIDTTGFLNEVMLEFE